MGLEVGEDGGVRGTGGSDPWTSTYWSLELGARWVTWSLERDSMLGEEASSSI